MERIAEKREVAQLVHRFLKIILDLTLVPHGGLFQTVAIRDHLQRMGSPYIRVNPEGGLIHSGLAECDSPCMDKSG